MTDSFDAVFSERSDVVKVLSPSPRCASDQEKPARWQQRAAVYTQGLGIQREDAPTRMVKSVVIVKHLQGGNDASSVGLVDFEVVFD